MKIDLSKYQTSAGDYDLAAALNSEPDESFIKAHPYLPGQNGEKHKYVRVSVCRQILDLLFSMRWSWVIKTAGENMHGTDYIVTGTITIQTKDGFTRTVDGIGADAYQVNKATGAVQQNAVMLSAPKAEAAAFKNAAKKLGRIFGSELDKSDQIDFLGAALEKEKPKEFCGPEHKNWEELCFIAETGKTSKGREISSGVKTFLESYQFTPEDWAYLLSLESARKNAPVADPDEASVGNNAPAPSDNRIAVSSKKPADKKVWDSLFNAIKTGKTTKGNAATVDDICKHYAFNQDDLEFLLGLEDLRRDLAQKQAVKAAEEDNDAPF